MCRICLILVAAVMLLATIAGCRKAEPTVAVEGQSDADIITENLLKSLNNMDYQGYLMNFDANAGKAWGEDYFTGTALLIQKKVGTYVAGSKVLTGTTTNQGFTDVTYKAEFSDEPDVDVIVSIYTSDNHTYAAGIWFNSPKLFSQ